MTEKWIGSYVYGDAYPEAMKGSSIPFVIEWTINDGILTGTCVDDETKDYYTQPATIQGFIDNGVISFIKKYPCYCSTDDEGNITLDENRPAAEIHYSGMAVENHYEGEWEINMTFVDEYGMLQEYDWTGTWFLYKESEL